MLRPRFDENHDGAPPRTVEYRLKTSHYYAETTCRFADALRIVVAEGREPSYS
jgi:hypothetical protein